MDQIPGRAADGLGAVDNAVAGRLGLSGVRKLLGVGGGTLRDEGHADAGAGNMVHHIAEIRGSGALSGRRQPRRSGQAGVLHQQLV